MLGIIPIYIDREHSFWRTTESKIVLDSLFHAVKESKQLKKTLVFTNDDRIGIESERQGMDAYVIEAQEMSSSSDILPFGTFSAIRFLKHTLKIDWAALTVFGYRNPLITSDLIDQAVKEYRSSGASVLMSIRRPVDHPCQLNSYYKIVDMVFIHLFDDREKAFLVSEIESAFGTGKQFQRSEKGNLHCRHPKDFVLTRPFYFDWAAKWIEKESATGIYVRIFHDTRYDYVSIEKFFEDFPADKPSKFWVKTGPKAAAILVLPSAPIHLPEAWMRDAGTDAVIGASLSGNFPSYFLVRNPSGKCFLRLIDPEMDFRPSHRIYLSRSDVNGAIENQPILIETDDPSAPIHVAPMDGSESGLLCSILKPAGDDYYDVSEPFTPAENLWEPKNHINQISGQKITGRQQFPEVYEPEGSIFIIGNLPEHSIRQEILQGKAYGFSIPDENCLHIDSILGLIRYLAIRKGQGACWKN